MSQQYTIRRKIISFLGAKFHIYRADGSLLGYCKQKAFKLKEDIRIYTNESQTDERMRISARSVIDFGATYDVFDSKSDTRLGSLRRSGLKSMLRDEWQVADETDETVGRIHEDSMALAIIRRVLPLPLPQVFHLTDGSSQFAEFRTHFNPFVHRMTITIPDNGPVNPLLILAGGVLLMTIEGRHNN